ncbi:MAG: helix-turn-helix domain-containing protein, partial [Candidatus Lokiarchaeota archaeon]|nr:helix-turn-helix domain-containing protein [Candidatus Lokiarchaeota archaeon]MBD3340372.1 helix-turn-helix domain-containing protein [Candidatus Lokiarchaeota archaeon]
MTIEKILNRINFLLRDAGFEMFQFDNLKSGNYCFDFLVKKRNSIFMIKVFPNIDNLNEPVVKNVKNLSVLLNSHPILIGIKNRYDKLEENTIYIREDLPFISLKTFENVLVQNVFPHILARRGGGVIFLDGDLMKSIRIKKGLSRKDISEKLGVTKRTICSYENESMRP